MSGTKTSPPKYDMALSGKPFNHHNDTWLWLLIWKEKFLNRNTAFFNPQLKTSIHCTFPCDAKAKNCQVVLSYVNINQSSTIMKAAYNMLCIFFWSRSSPSSFSFEYGHISSVLLILLLLPSCTCGMSSSPGAILAESIQFQPVHPRCFCPCDSHWQL